MDSWINGSLRPKTRPLKKKTPKMCRTEVPGNGSGKIFRGNVRFGENRVLFHLARYLLIQVVLCDRPNFFGEVK